MNTALLLAFLAVCYLARWDGFIVGGAVLCAWHVIRHRRRAWRGQIKLTPPNRGRARR